MYITQHLSFQDQLHSLTPIAQKTNKQTNKKNKKQKKNNVVGTQGFNQSIAN